MKFALLNTHQPNSHGFMIDSKSLDLARFQANPVMLYNHDRTQVIGKWSDITFENGQLSATPVFDEGDPLALEVKRKVDAGFIKGASVGIVVKDFEQTLAVGTQVFECSIVSVPSDPNALRLYDTNGKCIDDVDTFLLSFNYNNKKTMLKKETLTLLGLQDQPTDVDAVVVNLQSRCNALETQLQANEKQAKTALLAQAVKDKAITEAQIPTLEKLEIADLQAFLSHATPQATTPQAVSLASFVNKSAGVTDDRSTWTYLEWAKKDAKGLAELQATNPVAFAQLLTNKLK